MENKLYHVLTDAEFDQLVKEKLGFDYECVAENEWNNDSCYSSDNIKKEDGEKEYFQTYDAPSVEKMMRGESLDRFETVSFHDLLTYMVWKDMIPEGNYLIDVSW